MRHFRYLAAKWGRLRMKHFRAIAIFGAFVVVSSAPVMAEGLQPSIPSPEQLGRCVSVSAAAPVCPWRVYISKDQVPTVENLHRQRREYEEAEATVLAPSPGRDSDETVGGLP